LNVNVRPKAFQKRKPSPIMAQATGSAETFVRYVCVRAQAQLTQRLGREDQIKIAGERFPGDARLRTVIRAASEPPTDLSNAPALARMGVDYVESLQPISAAARLFRASEMMLAFDRNTAIMVPDVFGVDEGPPAWVASGQPAPVGELTANATILEPRKLEFIITVTREMLLGSNAEKLIGDALRTKIAFDLDKTVFDALPESAARPAGLRSYNARLGESNWTSGNDNAMLADVGTLMAAAEAIAGGSEFYFIARSRRIAAMRQLYKQVPPNLVLLPSSASLALPDSVLVCVIPRAVPSAIGLAEVELVDAAAVEMDDAPTSPDFSGGTSVRSFFQTDTLGLKVRLPASWGLRHPAGANWITCLWPADMGAGTGGGIPDAPADEFHYGRHQGGWDAVLAPGDVPEEVPTAPAAGAYARVRSAGAATWVTLNDIGVAPLASPIFTGAPRAPTPPPGTANDTIATTQFVADNAGAGGGVEDVPLTPSGAYARTRFAGDPAGWTTMADLGVASLTNPVFIGMVTVPNGTLAFPGIQFSDPSVGLYRSANLILLVAGGAGVAQFSSTVSAVFSPLFLNGNQLRTLGDPTAATDALNLQTADGRYLRSGGGPLVLTETLIAKPGTGVNDLGLGIGDGATGFYRDADGTGAGLSTMVGGFPIFMLTNAREAVINGPLSVGGNRIMAVANPTIGTDALNQQTGDARYLTLQQGGIVSGAVQFLFNPVLPTDAVTKGYVDNAVNGARAPSFVYDIPADITIPPNENWIDLATVPFTIPLRPGILSRVRLSVSCNLADMSNVAMLGVRIASDPDVPSTTFPERRVFGYGSQQASQTSSGFNVEFFAEPAAGATTMSIPLQIKQFNIGSPLAPIRVLGGAPTVGVRSQIIITDLGPA
jgi:hypothetical protein